MASTPPFTGPTTAHRSYASVLPDRQPIDDVQRIDAAPLHLRVPALLIDGLILVAPAAFIHDVGLTPGTLEGGILEALLALALSLVTLPVTFLPGVVLLALLEWRTGKTAGKALMGIRVTGVEDGEPIGLLRSVARRGFMVVESHLYFVPSLILIPFNRGFDGHLGDRLTGAIVARDRDIDAAFDDR